jgi:hypothetical protein
MINSYSQQLNKYWGSRTLWFWILPQIPSLPPCFQISYDSESFFSMCTPFLFSLGLWQKNTDNINTKRKLTNFNPQEQGQMFTWISTESGCCLGVAPSPGPPYHLQSSVSLNIGNLGVTVGKVLCYHAPINFFLSIDCICRLSICI